eukprot:212541-Rhodomonas_salina.1
MGLPLQPAPGTDSFVRVPVRTVAGEHGGVPDRVALRRQQDAGRALFRVPERYWHSVGCARTCDAKGGTDIAYAALYGTGMVPAFARAVRCAVLRWWLCTLSEAVAGVSAMCGTEIAASVCL